MTFDTIVLPISWSEAYGKGRNFSLIEGLALEPISGALMGMAKLKAKNVSGELGQGRCTCHPQNTLFGFLVRSSYGLTGQEAQPKWPRCQSSGIPKPGGVHIFILKGPDCVPDAFGNFLVGPLRLLLRGRKGGKGQIRKIPE